MSIYSENLITYGQPGLRLTDDEFLVPVFCRIVFRGYNKSSSFPSSPVNGFDDINELLLVGQGKVDLVVITCSQINLHVFVSVEKHHGNGVVELVHCVEVRDFLCIDEVDNGIVLKLLGGVEQNLVHLHALGIVVMSEPHDY